MRKYNIPFAVIALVFASLACQAVMGDGGSGAPEMPTNDGGGNESAPTFIPPGDSSGIPTEVTIPPIATDEHGNITIGGTPDFPLPDDATNTINMGGDLITFQTKLSLDEMLKFYRDKLPSLGYKEKESEAFTTDTVFNLTFEDPKNNKVVSIQGVDMSGITSITISMSDK